MKSRCVPRGVLNPCMTSKRLALVENNGLPILGTLTRQGSAETREFVLDIRGKLIY